MFCRNCGNEFEDGVLFCPYCGNRVAVQAEASIDSNPQEPNKKSKKGVVAAIIGIAALVIIALGLFFGIKLLGKKNGSSYVYVTEEGLFYVESISSKEGIQIYDGNVSDTDVNYSPDGEYIYFFTDKEKLNENDYYFHGTLNRIKISSIQKNKDNEEEVEKIGKNIQLNISIFKDGVAYERDDDKICFFDGKKENIIYEGGFGGIYAGNENGCLVYLKKEGDAKCGDLYRVYTDDLGNEEKIDSDVIGSYGSVDMNEFYYKKMSSNYSESEKLYDLYSVDKEGNTAYQFTYEIDDAYKDPESGNVVFIFYAETDETVDIRDYIDEDSLDIESMGNDSSSYVIKVYDLYVLKDGEINELCEDAVSLGTYGNVIFFSTKDRFDPNVIPEEDLSDFVTDRKIKTYLKYDYSKYVVDIESGMLWDLDNHDDINDVYLSCNPDTALNYRGPKSFAWNNALYLFDYGEEIIYKVEISKDKSKELGTPTELLDAYGLAYLSDRIYYVNDTYKDGSIITGKGSYERPLVYGDLYAYSDGDSGSLIAEEIILSTGVYVYSDGIIVAATDEKNSELEYSIIKDREIIESFSDVTDIIRITGDDYIYLSDDDLYIYDGKNNVKISSDVLSFYPKRNEDYDLMGFDGYEEED